MPLRRNNPNYNVDTDNGPPPSLNTNPNLISVPSPPAPYYSHNVSPIEEENSYHPPADRSHPAAHPDSSFSRMREQRYSGTDYPPPRPPVHGNVHHQPVMSQVDSTITTGADNLGAAAVGGGIAGIATGVASGNNGAQRGMNEAYRPYPDDQQFNGNGNPDPFETPGHGSPYLPPSDRGLPGNHSQPAHYQGGFEGDYNDRYRRNTAALGPMNPESINPNDILDDGDDGFLEDPKRRSLLTGANSSRGSLPRGAGVAGAGAAATGGALAATSSLGNVHSPTGLGDDPAHSPAQAENSEWLEEQKSRKKRTRWIIGILIAILIAGGIAGGVAGGILSNKDDSGSGSSSDDSSSSGGGSFDSAEEDEKQNGDLDVNSKEIKELMGNPDLHKVFPGIDYTPWGTQYPLCLTYPPSQNNVTRDIAVLSQLSNTVRLYGTDCNQTQMVLHAIDRLELKDMKLWMGVWIDTNTTTNERQLEQMYDILDSVDDTSIFKGIIVGNEYLFRGRQTQTALSKLSEIVKKVKSNIADLDIDLPISTSDLGDAWTEGLAEITDVVMANVHPFFAGVPVEKAAGWTWTFWTGHNLPLTEGTKKNNLIAEVGWPTGGGNSCGSVNCTSKDEGSVAGIDELNVFMEDWVCPSLENGTDYFWFEAFDEPWKVSYNEEGREWEDKWGLMDPGRNLKPGLKIPDCGGKTAD